MSSASSRSNAPREAARRSALIPALLAAAALFIAPVTLEGEWFTLIRYVVSILALIVGWYAIEARHWWWAPVMLAVAVVWNPVWPLAFSGPVWLGAQVIGAAVFLAAGILISRPRTD